MFCSECGKELVNDANVCSYCGKLVQSSNQQNYSMQQQYNNLSYNNYDRSVTFKPDNKFNLVAGLFTWIWAPYKGMWDLFLINLIIYILCGMLVPFF